MAHIDAWPGPEFIHTTGIKAGSFEDLAEIVITTHGAERGLGMVCGPITTGGTGNERLNFAIIGAVQEGFRRRGELIFDQTPFEFGLRILMKKWKAEGNTGYCMPILDVFYARLFEHRIIGSGIFVPGWPTSQGAAWERQKFAVMGAPIRDVTREELRSFMRVVYSPMYVERAMSRLPPP